MQILWTLPALQDLENIADYIAEYNPLAAYEVTQDIYNKTSLALSEYPLIGREGRVSETREFVVPQTAYIVAYQIRDERIEVLAVQRGSQRWPENF